MKALRVCGLILIVYGLLRLVLLLSGCAFEAQRGEGAVELREGESGAARALSGHAVYTRALADAGALVEPEPMDAALQGQPETAPSAAPVPSAPTPAPAPAAPAALPEPAGEAGSAAPVPMAPEPEPEPEPEPTPQPSAPPAREPTASCGILGYPCWPSIEAGCDGGFCDPRGECSCLPW